MPNIDFNALIEYFNGNETGYYTQAAIRASIYLNTLPEDKQQELAEVIMAL